MRIITLPLLLPVIVFIMVANTVFAQQTAEISGSFEGAKENSKICIWSDRDPSKMDSCRTTGNKFKFTIKPEKGWAVYFVGCPSLSRDYSLPLFLKGGSKIHVTVSKELNKFTISGDSNAEEQNRYYKGADSIYRAFAQVGDKASEHTTNYGVQWVKDHHNSPFSAAIIRLYLSSGSIEAEDKVAKACYSFLSQQAKKDNYECELLESQFSWLDDKYEVVGQPGFVKDFVIRDTLGHEIRFNDFKGSWLLMDFWASWCGPCRENVPELREVYEKYKGKGLKVLSISVDTDPEKWKKAIQSLGMEWLHGSDLKGQLSGVAHSYRINAIPRYFLFAPDGKVVIWRKTDNLGAIADKLKEAL
ncbi:AhpC/TSA family protein [Chitinophaga polysaccharea]|uniref:TlpA disulfide reductase family protein n=1 Tax=Chitinophaga TaxID=79328 RepID=UPI00145534A6|nr:MULTISPECIES: TlpA disulfide reductase family protein [Chitinophaga]NLR62649.1 AhpC/TSA family protein [Chitinophaga polysaccharea]NLU91461.1 AhpC/TSA family protein [Chitinophaga sp. Ak27]